MSNDGKDMELVNKNATPFSKAKDNKEQKDFEKDMADDGYDQDMTADFDGVKVGGRHFVFRAPKKKKESGIILSETTQKEVANVQKTPGFNEDIVVTKVAEKCEIVEEGDHILLSPHTQALDIDMPAQEDPEKKVLYLMVHEDYVLMAKPSNK